MDKFGTDLFMMLMAKAWPNPDKSRIERVTWAQVEKFFFENATPIRTAAIGTETAWSKSGIEDLDIALMQLAEAGEFVGVFDVSPAAAKELWRRWQYAIIAAGLDSAAGEEFGLPLPMDAPAALKGLAIMLYVLGGPARDYDPRMFKD